MFNKETRRKHLEIRKSKNLKARLRREAIFSNFSPWKAIFIMVMPTIISMLIFSTYQIFDKWIATQWGGGSIIANYPGINITPQEAIKIINIATTYAAVPSALMVAFSTLVSVGTAVKFSITYGKNNKEKMANYLGNGFILSFALSIIFMVVMYFVTVDIIKFQANGDNNVSDQAIKNIIETEAIHFSRALVLATPLLFFSNFWLVLLRSEGRVISNIVIIVISCVVNIALDFAFVIGFNLGMIGTAFATIIAWFLNFVMAIGLIYYTGSNLIINFKHLRLKRALAVGILILGLTSLLQNAASGILAMVTTKLLNSLPPPTDYTSDSNIPIYVQLYGGIMPWLILINAPFIGVSQGSRALVAYVYGTKDYNRVWQITWRLFVLLFVLLCGSLLLVVAAGQYMMHFFGVDLKMANHFKTYIIVQFAFYPLATLHYISVIVLQGINRGKISLFASLQRTIIMPVICLALGYVIATKAQDGFYFYLMLGMIDVFAAIVLAPLLIYSYIKAKPFIYSPKIINESITNRTQ